MPSLKVAALALLVASVHAFPASGGRFDSRMLRRQSNETSVSGSSSESATPSNSTETSTSSGETETATSGSSTESSTSTETSTSGSSTESSGSSAESSPGTGTSTETATAAAPAGNLTDPDILQFALTLEHLESAFYQQGFAKFPDSDFAALGLKDNQIKDLKGIGQTEQQHVTFLQSALAQAGVQPVKPCEYDFKFTDAKGMATTGALLENVGISAYLGAAKLVQSKDILEAAGSILTIESRHQSSLRVLLGQVAVPQAFDAPLGPRAVFTMAAPFIKSCPQGSNLSIQPFPTLTMESTAAPAVGQTVKVKAASGANGATNCAFTSGGVVPGGTSFTKFSEAEGCQIPQNVGGVTYLALSNAAPADGVLTDEMVVAGPLILGL